MKKLNEDRFILRPDAECDVGELAKDIVGWVLEQRTRFQMKKIDSFSGEYRFLSNFWPAQVKLDGHMYPTTEHAYQAAKFLDEEVRKNIREAKTASLAKKMGQGGTLRPDWESVKLSVMEDILRQKFQNPELKEMLLDTGTAELIEGNSWGDVWWGVCKGVGKNNLGKLLMKIRNELDQPT